ncbi:hypothetical protein EVG20_g4711 [Dentipellis fragilis]|uniref:Uncharacterized protein n=1 Tax=Dentipellis fragilis TaxID=205917 RepID=A0A4Y9YXM0_9AGAM|nr:hypothetical protein EVG20_g4711 [Dentipellis fragilis]
MPVKETPSLLLFQHIIQARSATSRGDEDPVSHPQPSAEDIIVERDFGVVLDSEPTLPGNGLRTASPLGVVDLHEGLRLDKYC